uniref:alkene reductase n=1 Tax=Methylobacterium sp. B34 TaxID=95563 RepID=UPI0005B289DD|nr:alkene reductase [Methylobacterium sp. B34]
MTEISDLFEPAKLGAIHLSNRIIMAPLTRSRAGKAGIHGPMNAEYYSQRATAGLIIAEASNVSLQAKANAFTPGCYTPEQEAGWRLVTDAVHAAGGKITLQLLHAGRLGHPDMQPGHALPVAPSAVKADGDAFTENGFKPYVTPRALETDEIAGIVREHADAAAGAKRAGFDGVEIHAANGYLLDQFIRDGTNHRVDGYGGSRSNRLRLTLEVMEAVASVWSGDRVGIRLSPLTNRVGGIPLDSDPMGTYGELVERLNGLDLAYLHCIEGVTQGDRAEPAGFSFQNLRTAFKGSYVANNGYTREMALKARREGTADFVCFGRPFLSNPDFVERLRRDAPLNADDKDNWYGGDARGYTDFPTLDAD